MSEGWKEDEREKEEREEENDKEETRQRIKNTRDSGRGIEKEVEWSEWSERSKREKRIGK